MAFFDTNSKNDDNMSAHNSLSSEAKNARARADALLESLNKRGRQNENSMNEGMRSGYEKDGMYHITPLELQCKIED